MPGSKPDAILGNIAGQGAFGHIQVGFVFVQLGLQPFLNLLGAGKAAFPRLLNVDPGKRIDHVGCR